MEHRLIFERDKKVVCSSEFKVGNEYFLGYIRGLEWMTDDDETGQFEVNAKFTYGDNSMNVLTRDPRLISIFQSWLSSNIKTIVENEQHPYGKMWLTKTADGYTAELP